MSGLLIASIEGGDVVRGVITLFAILGAVTWVLERRSRGETQQTLKAEIARTGRVESHLGDVMLFTDPPRLGVVTRTVTGDLVHQSGASLEVRPITSDVKASTEAAGNMSVTRGRNLAQKALGTALVPGGAFLFGNAKETQHDFRELYLIVEAADWAITLAVDPDHGVAARQFAQIVNQRARELAPAKPPQEHPVGDVLDRLERLTRLRDAGSLSDAEFESQKAAVLGQPGDR
jgi:hypothetical protein